jgi:hypothetical protein
MPGSQGFCRLLCRQGAATFEAKERKKFTDFVEGESSRM